MSAPTVRWDRAWAVFLVMAIIIAARWSPAAAQNPDAQAVTTAAAVRLEYIPKAPELSTLKRTLLSRENVTSRVNLSYYHSLIQENSFSNTNVGPTGVFNLPGSDHHGVFVDIEFIS